MKRIVAIALSLLPAVVMAEVGVSHLRVNRLEQPMGVSPTDKVTFSWELSSTEKNTMQTAYEVVVTSEGKTVWNSGKVASDNSVAVAYEGLPLASDSRYAWSVRVWDNHGKVSKRASSSWQTGLTPSDWKAEWIVRPSQNKPEPSHFRTEYKATKRIRRATAYIASHGLYEAYINGNRIGNYMLTPGWTAYQKRIQYQAYDVTALLRTGRNAVAAIVTPGWYSGGLGYVKVEKRFRYGDDTALLMQINIEYADGTRDIIATDNTWQTAGTEAMASGITFANIYDGETIDARKCDTTWTTINGATWEERATVADCSKQVLISTINEPVIKHKSLRPVAYIVTPKGEKVLDFGQNLVGWERARLRGKAGQTVKIYHAEILDPRTGNFYTKNLRLAKATSTYILDGNEHIFEPTMTFYGFRYIKVEGIEGDLSLDDFTAEVVYSGFDTIGSFSSSNETINALQHNIDWGFRGNFVDIPTDCPQRDERLGWTGDAQVFFRTASFLGGVDTFFRKWLADVAADQRADGRIAKIVPDVFPTSKGRNGATGWADVATIIPWQHYMAFGDKAILEQQYPSMCAWVDYMVKQSRDRGWLWNNGDHYGDWLFWNKANDPDGVSAVTSKHLIAQCFFAGSADIVARTAELLGRTDDAAHYKEVAANVRQAYLNEYVSPNGLVSSDTQTAYVLALYFDMLPESLRPQAAKRLANNVIRYNYHITTGFLGTPYICNILTEYGYTDLAYRLLLQDTCPSWIYPISKGATTVWERWDSIRPDDSIIDGMNSFNHYSYGSIGDWLYRCAVGLHETSAGYKTIAIRPHVGGDFQFMKASTRTPYGTASAEWHADGNTLRTLSVTIPANTTAEIYVPAKKGDAVEADDPSLKGKSTGDGYVKFMVGSGSYNFTVK